MATLRLPIVAGYTLLDQLGTGGFASVLRARHVSNDHIAACKLVRFREGMTAAQRKSAECEVRIHAALEHPNIIGYINAAIVEYNDPKYVPGIYILMPLAPSDLLAQITPDIGLNEVAATRYLQQLLAGVLYMHQEGVCHRDLKPDNILIDSDGNLRIADFGLASVFRIKATGETRQLTGMGGSLPYAAPEILEARAYDAEPVDAWGVGVILFTILTGNTPWDEPTMRSSDFQGYVSGIILREKPWSSFSSSALSLIQGLLHIDPLLRLTITGASSHPWALSVM